jgi:hypothetical protein
MRKLTVLTFKWHGWRDVFHADHVNALGRMLQHYLKIPHRLICITDEPEGVQCETFPVWADPFVPRKPTKHDTYRRLKLFSVWAAQQWPGWILVIDLDVVIVGDMTPLITWDDFRILKGGVSRYRAGMWLHRTGSRVHIWESFDPETSPFVITTYTTNGKPWRGSDQGWISVQCPHERTYTSADGVYMWLGQVKRRGKIPPNARIIFPMGDVKPWHNEMRKQSPALWKAYQRWLT